MLLLGPEAVVGGGVGWGASAWMSRGLFFSGTHGSRDIRIYQFKMHGLQNNKNQNEIMVGEDINELILCINRLRENQDIRVTIGENGAKFVRDNYQWGKTTAILIDLINN